MLFRSHIICFQLLNRSIFFIHSFYAVNCWTGTSYLFTYYTLSTAEQVHLFCSHIIRFQLLNRSIYFVHTFYAFNCWTGPSFSFTHSTLSTAEQVHLLRSHILRYQLLNRSIFFVHTFYAFNFWRGPCYFIHSFYAINCWTGPSFSFTHFTLSTAEQVHLFHSLILRCQLLNRYIFFIQTFYALNIQIFIKKNYVFLHIIRESTYEVFNKNSSWFNFFFIFAEQVHHTFYAVNWWKIKHKIMSSSSISTVL